MKGREARARNRCDRGCRSSVAVAPLRGAARFEHHPTSSSNRPRDEEASDWTPEHRRRWSRAPRCISRARRSMEQGLSSRASAAFMSASERRERAPVHRTMKGHAAPRRARMPGGRVAVGHCIMLRGQRGRVRHLRSSGSSKDAEFDILPSLSLRCRLATERKGIPRLLPSWFLLPRRLPEGMAWLSP